MMDARLARCMRTARLALRAEHAISSMLRGRVEALEAEVEALNLEIQTYQVDDGYQRGYEHGRAAMELHYRRLAEQRRLLEWADLV